MQLRSRPSPSGAIVLFSLLAVMGLGALIGCSAPAAAPTPAAKAAVTSTQAPAPPPATKAPSPPQATQPAAAAATAAKPPAQTALPAPAKDTAQKAAPANIKDTLVTGYSVDLEHFDAHRHRSTSTTAASSLIFETLVGRDPQTMALTPMLATSWKTVDPLTWEFKLRQGVKFTNGEDFNAESVKVSFERVFRKDLENTGPSYLGDSYGSVEGVDPSTVRFKTTGPSPTFAEVLASQYFSMVPPKWGAAVEEKEAVLKPVGSGPYKLAEFLAAERTVLERNDAYWGEKSPTKKLVWKTIPDARTRAAALQRGEVDLIDNLFLELVPSVERDPNLKIYSAVGSLTHKLVFNVSQKGPAYLQDKRVRQALNHAVDKQALIKGLYRGLAEEYFSVIPRQMADYSAGTPYEYDPEKSKKLLAEAGYPNGFETEVWVPIARYTNAEQAVQAMVDYFSKVGVKAKIVTAEWSVYNAKASVSMETMFYYPHANSTWQPDQPLAYFLPERKRWNYYIPAASTQEVIRKAGQETDQQKRHTLLIQAQKELWAETPWLTLYHLPSIYGLNKKLNGFFESANELRYYQRAYIEQ